MQRSGIMTHVTTLNLAFDVQARARGDAPDAHCARLSADSSECRHPRAMSRSV